MRKSFTIKKRSANLLADRFCQYSLKSDGFLFRDFTFEVRIDCHADCVFCKHGAMNLLRRQTVELFDNLLVGEFKPNPAEAGGRTGG